MLRFQNVILLCIGLLSAWSAGCSATRQPVTFEEPSYSYVRAGDHQTPLIDTPATLMTSEQVGPDLAEPATASPWRPTLTPPVAIEPQS